jgi:hypothetical protein
MHRKNTHRWAKLATVIALSCFVLLGLVVRPASALAINPPAVCVALDCSVTFAPAEEVYEWLAPEGCSKVWVQLEGAQDEVSGAHGDLKIVSFWRPPVKMAVKIGIATEIAGPDSVVALGGDGSSKLGSVDSLDPFALAQEQVTPLFASFLGRGGAPVGPGRVIIHYKRDSVPSPAPTQSPTPTVTPTPTESATPTPAESATPNPTPTEKPLPAAVLVSPPSDPPSAPPVEPPVVPAPESPAAPVVVEVPATPIAPIQPVVQEQLAEPPVIDFALPTVEVEPPDVQMSPQTQAKAKSAKSPSQINAAVPLMKPLIEDLPRLKRAADLKMQPSRQVLGWVLPEPQVLMQVGALALSLIAAAIAASRLVMSKRTASAYRTRFRLIDVFS